jgi:competence protein ComEC
VENTVGTVANWPQRFAKIGRLSPIPRLESWLEIERDRLPLWLPVGFGAGIAIWEAYWDTAYWAILLISGALLFLGAAAGQGGRLRMILIATALTISAGYGAIAAKSYWVAAPTLEKLTISRFYGLIQKVDMLPARDVIRLQLATGGYAGLPNLIRVNLDNDQYRPQFVVGAVIELRARLMPPASPMLPGGYDFARRIWFSGIGATGTALGEVTLHKPSNANAGLASARANLTAHIRNNMSQTSGGIGAALITGDTGGIDPDVAQSMRDSGMAHLLSISGLHVTAVVGAVFLLCSRLLALFPIIALRYPIPLLAAGAGAAAAIGYTLLSGAEVPTVRSCVAALLILGALAIGREALSLRLIAFGALFVLIFWPESMAGPSFQLSFAAVTTIVVLHESQALRNFLNGYDRGWPMRLGLGFASLLITGIAIEAVLSPITMAHFNRAGLYGALANIVAIPLTTFIIMPFEGLALMFDMMGLGAPFWWVAQLGIELLVWIANSVSAWPGAVSSLPNMPNWAFAAMIIGGLWTAIFQTRHRFWGALPFTIGFIAMLLAPRPDILITGDGKHVALVDAHGQIAILRARAGDYVKDALAETAGITAEAIDIDQWPGADCTEDACVVTVNKQGRYWTILATRTRYAIPAMELAAACRRVDIAISDRWLPYSCQPKWMKIDRNFLANSGGVAINLSNASVETVSQSSNGSPWQKARKLAADKEEGERKMLRKPQPNQTVPPTTIETISNLKSARNQ